MDAVRTKIEALGGALELDSTPGQGTRVRIRLPLTLAIIQALLIQVHEETYAIPLGSIDSTINITPADIRDDTAAGGYFTAWVRLFRWFGSAKN